MHALVGENGAGKSTLMKILYGMQKPDEGTIAVDGEQVAFSSPADAIARGIGMVHQHFMLADNLTVLENVVLGSEKLHGIGGGARKKIRRSPTATGSASAPTPSSRTSASPTVSASRSSRSSTGAPGPSSSTSRRPSSSRRRSTPSSRTCANSSPRAWPSSSSPTSWARSCRSPTRSPSSGAVRRSARPSPPRRPRVSSPS